MEEDIPAAIAQANEAKAAFGIKPFNGAGEFQGLLGLPVGHHGHRHHGVDRRQTHREVRHSCHALRNRRVGS